MGPVSASASLFFRALTGGVISFSSILCILESLPRTSSLTTAMTWKKSCDKPRQHIKKQRHHFVDRSLQSQSYSFSSSQLRMWELDHKESWASKNWCFWTVVLEKTLQSPLDSKEIKPVSPRGNQSLMCIGRNDAEAETPIWCEELTQWKGPWSWERLKAGGEGVIEDEMNGWHHRLSGHEFEQTLGGRGGQGSLACCSSWGRKESHTT